MKAMSAARGNGDQARGGTQTRQAAAAQLGALLESIVRDTDVLTAGNLMADVFESRVTARAQPAPKTGLAVAMLRGRVAREELKREEGGSLSAAAPALRPPPRTWLSSRRRSP